nr:immunoglobulin light chain junction region [Macaca mulatta]MOV77977.1 immunoglobulin light chain junction region [Macaca mulatta]MOV78472.1 immunoglobulin light chain junction region [Macaca mulatta]MOV79251.1 immunoglobulin light chain junction region [Macaca mulatta]MOV79687.1 immunoglobulin light chain junction region [Macaca mulatta]
CLQYKSYPYSF